MSLAERPPALRAELPRKVLHVGTGGLALLLRWLTPLEASLAALAALGFNALFLHRVTRHALLRAGERARGFSWGTLLYPASVLGLVLVFHQRLELAAAAWGILAFGDGMATIVGAIVGGPLLAWNARKTWSGSCAFVLYGTAAAMFLIRWTQAGVLEGRRGGTPPTWIGDSFLADGPGLALLGCLAAALAAALVESLDTPIDDNVRVPLVAGIVLYVATLVEPERLLAQAAVLRQQLGVGLALNAVLGTTAYAARAVGPSGLLVGGLLGTALFVLGGWAAWLPLLAFFVLGTLATRIGYAGKARAGLAQERGGRRGARHALANVSLAVVLAFLAVAAGPPALWRVGLAAALATAACDTVATEIGQAFGRRHYLVTTWRRVAAGTPGAVSLEGTLAGAAAAATVAALAWTLGLTSPVGSSIVVGAAVAGALLESYVGAGLEARLRLSNDGVNWLNTLAGAALAMVLYGLAT